MSNVERTGWFIKEQHRCLLRQGTSDHGTLTFAPTQTGDETISKTRQVESLQQAVTPCRHSQRSSGWGRIEKNFCRARCARGSRFSSGRTDPVRRFSADIESPSLCTNSRKTAESKGFAIDPENPGN